MERRRRQANPESRGASDRSESVPSLLALADQRVPGGGDILSATLMAAATVESAWCAYQAALWTGNQIRALAEASAAQFDSVREMSEASAFLHLRVEVGARAQRRGADRLRGLEPGERPQRPLRPAHGPVRAVPVLPGLVVVGSPRRGPPDHVDPGRAGLRGCRDLDGAAAPRTGRAPRQGRVEVDGSIPSVRARYPAAFTDPVAEARRDLRGGPSVATPPWARTPTRPDLAVVAPARPPTTVRAWRHKGTRCHAVSTARS